MAAELPATFDDISGVSGAVFDDFHCSGFGIDAKKETNWDGASTEFSVDVGSKCSATVSFSHPKPIAALEGFALDKYEFDGDGKSNFEFSLDEKLHKVPGLTIGVSSDSLFKDLTFSKSYAHGPMDARVNFSTTKDAPQDFTLETIKRQGNFVIGARLNGLTSLCPAMALSTSHGPFSVGLLAENKFSEIGANCCYSVSDDISVGASYQYGGENAGNWAAGASMNINKELSAKAKFESDQNLSVGFQKELAKGTSLVGGFTYSLTKGDVGYGAKMLIE